MAGCHMSGLRRFNQRDSGEQSSTEHRRATSPPLLTFGVITHGPEPYGWFVVGCLLLLFELARALGLYKTSHGYFSRSKGYEGKRPRTWAEITKAGRGGLAAQVAAMTEIIARYEAAAQPDPSSGRRKASPDPGGVEGHDLGPAG